MKFKCGTTNPKASGATITTQWAKQVLLPLPRLWVDSSFEEVKQCDLRSICLNHLPDGEACTTQTTSSSIISKSITHSLRLDGPHDAAGLGGKQHTG